MIDFDTVDISNLHRQVFYSLKDIGKLKSECLSNFIQQRSPFTEVSFSREAITKENAIELISEYDVIIDGTDSLPTKYLLNDVCVILEKPLVYGSLYKFDGYVSAFNLKQEDGSFSGWDTITNQSYLNEVISEFKNAGIRTSIFIDTDLKLIEAAAKIGTDRIELYTENFASAYDKGNKQAIKPYTEAANLAHNLGLGINAGHDVSLDNVEFFKQNIPNLAEVSIGHALISESLYLGLQNVVNMYLHRLQ